MKAAIRSVMCLGMMSLSISSVALADGDAVTGKEAAREWCARCHDVEPGGQLKQDPPAFTAIANFRSPEYIHANITFPHQRMPDVAQVLGLNVDDLVAYIVSLEEPCF
ncbi:MAG: c-type cytochrome [Alphaproteobacteria bacterium]|nr:c-type cytochrome [Alphaproteobacteria bacterium]